MLKVFSYLHTISLYPAARMIVWWQSERQRLRTFGQRPKVHFDDVSDGRRIMLLALYEKGRLRPDVVRLLRAAQAEGLYVLAVNTLKIKDVEALKGLVNCYIERPNFGRDFGSYKTGFLHFFDRGWQDKCPRLMMVNDSIYFSEQRLSRFIQDMMQSEVEVLGSTENYEIEHHLGSFCIAMAQTILQSPVFKKYWRSYFLSDVRPSVIKRGEMELSKTLRRVATSPRQFRALYSTARFLRDVRDNEALVDFVIKNARTSNLTGWEQLNAFEVCQDLRNRFVSEINLNKEEANDSLEIHAKATLQEMNRSRFVQDSASLKSFILEHVDNSEDVDDEIVKDTIVSVLARVFMSGSQIHQNSTTLLKLGLPIIKLDGMYRGMFNVYDVQRICAQLSEQEANELKDILLERPFGGDTLVGWRRAAFMVGLI